MRALLLACCVLLASCSAPDAQRDAGLDAGDAAIDAFSCTPPEREVPAEAVDCGDLVSALDTASACSTDADCVGALVDGDCACVGGHGAACGRDVWYFRALYERLGSECGLAATCDACEPSDLSCIDHRCRVRDAVMPACADAAREPRLAAYVSECACQRAYVDFVVRFDEAGVAVEVHEPPGVHRPDWSPELASCLLDGYWLDACFPSLAGREIELSTGSCTI